ncbi:hypothetical protein ACFP81_08470 [Deinococcus lacus]|uniref:POTRA domain-containing protein n=1 Tax=Deinococcus lacus TaxID=392561 RepID=A0ABW1YF16_9DEIO
MFRALTCLAALSLGGWAGANAAVPAVPPTALPPSTARPQPAVIQTPLLLAPRPGTLLEFRTVTRLTVDSVKPDLRTRDQNKLPEGVLAAIGDEMFGPESLEELRALLAEDLESGVEQKFFIRVLPPTQAGTVRLALTLLTPKTASEPAQRLSTVHTLSPSGKVLGGEVDRAASSRQQGTALAQLSAEELWIQALAQAGFDPSGIYGVLAGAGEHTDVAQTVSAEAFLASTGLGTEEIEASEVHLRGVTTLQELLPGGSRRYLQVTHIEPWETQLVTREGRRTQRIPMSFEQFETRGISRYRADGLPQELEATVNIIQFLGLPLDPELPFDVTLEVRMHGEQKTRLVQVTEGR